MTREPRRPPLARPIWPLPDDAQGTAQRGIAESRATTLLQAQRRRVIATAALQGLLASTPLAAQPPSNADAMASRAVRYADALLEALNRTTTEALHARDR